MIHPSALVAPGASIDPSCEIGPLAVIEEHVTLGPGCRVGPHVHLTGHTTIGPGNIFHTGCVIGGPPQDLKYRGEPTRLRIGAQNVFREHVTINRSNQLAEDTVIGSHNFLMAHCHIGHNSSLGSHIVLASGALVAGHVIILDSAFISGNCLIHQFVRVGRLALMQGGSAISKDLPPATIARGDNGICGLNIIGLRRAGVSAPERVEMKRLYHQLFRSGLNLSAGLRQAQGLYNGPLALETLQFITSSRRGVCTDHGFQPDDPAPTA